MTRRADIVWISKQPERFINGPRLAIFEQGGPVEGERTFIRQLLNMDPPDHAKYRDVASGWFTPRSIARRREEVQRITRELLANDQARALLQGLRNIPHTIGKYVKDSFDEIEFEGKKYLVVQRSDVLAIIAG